MGARFLPYQSASYNCQVFIMGVLDGNGLNNSERTSFVKQDTKSIFKNNPILRKFANTLTDIGGYANAIIQSTDLHRNSKPKPTLTDISATPTTTTTPTTLNNTETKTEEKKSNIEL